MITNKDPCPSCQEIESQLDDAQAINESHRINNGELHKEILALQEKLKVAEDALERERRL